MVEIPIKKENLRQKEDKHFDELRIMFYASGTAGLGHLSRCVTLGTTLRKLEPSAQILIVTESNTTQLALEANIACISVASFAPYLNSIKSGLQDGIPSKRRLLLWEALLESIMKAFCPTIVIHDTYVLGPIKKFAKICGAAQVGVLRQSAKIQTRVEQILQDLDLIIVPHTLDEHGTIGLPEAYLDRTLYTGGLVRRTPSELVPEILRKKYALQDDEFAIVATNGGGNQPMKKPSGETRREDDFLQAMIDSAILLHGILSKTQRVRIILITGPQAIRKPPLIQIKEASNIILTIQEYESFLPDLMAAVNAVICRGGYNTVHEVVEIGIPAIAIPVTDIFDDQPQRISWAMTKNSAIQMGSLDPFDIATRIQLLIEQSWWKFVPMVAEQDKSLQAKMTAAQRILSCKT